MSPTPEMLDACLDSCRALQIAYKRIVRRNVEAVLRSHFQTEDPKLVDEAVAETLRRLKSL